jgi:hypothetical protein
MMFLLLFSLFNYVYSQDNHNCNVEAGYTWCDYNHKCLNNQYEPCIPITNDCIDCLTTNFGNNLNCGRDCSIENLIELRDSGILGTDSNGCLISDEIKWCEVLNTCILKTESCPLQEDTCQYITCPIFCENGYQTNSNGCSICVCNLMNDNSCPLDRQICQPHYKVCPITTEITQCSAGGIPGYTTYELSLKIMDGDIYNIFALYGDGNNQGHHMMTIPPSYQAKNVFNSDFGGVPEEIIDINPNLRYDSWLTIGVTDGDMDHIISSIGIDFDDWNEMNSLTIDNGAIFLLAPQNENIFNKDNNIVIAHLTIKNELRVTAIFNVQGKNNGGGSWSQNNIVFDLKKSRHITNELIGH